MATTETTPLLLPVPKEKRQWCTLTSSTAIKVRILTSIISLIEGYDIGVVNGAVVLFKEDLDLSFLQVSIILSIFPLGVSLCAPFAASLADWKGRKPAMAMSCMLLILGGVFMGTATSFWMLALGRVTAGMGVGVGITAVTAYMAEVAPASHRGLFGSLEELFVNLGNVVGYLTNLALLDVANNWRYMLGGGVLPAFAVALVLLLPDRVTGIPESPRYLYKQNRTDTARAVLADLLNESTEVEDALEEWSLEENDDKRMADWPESLTAFCTTRRSSALAGIGCGVLNMFTGIMLMMVTTTMLLVSIGMTKREAMQASIFIGLAKATVMLVVATCVLDDWGRRPLLLTSLMICIMATVLGATSAHCSWGSAWIVISLCLFVTGYSFGVGPVPWVYMPEVLDSRLRGKGCALGVGGARLCAATHLFCFPVVFPLIGIAGLFAFLVTVNVLGFVYVYFLCPETTGVTLERIPSLFHEDSRSLRSPKNI